MLSPLLLPLPVTEEERIGSFPQDQRTGMKPKLYGAVQTPNLSQLSSPVAAFAKKQGNVPSVQGDGRRGMKPTHALLELARTGNLMSFFIPSSFCCCLGTNEGNGNASSVRQAERRGMKTNVLLVLVRTVTLMSFLLLPLMKKGNDKPRCQPITLDDLLEDQHPRECCVSPAVRSYRTLTKPKVLNFGSVLLLHPPRFVKLRSTWTRQLW